ncbi:hypothetical protein PybrP1_003318 [[Pythium] brassicae (nom. inval.)]|nr:hypothetical protein PybrP1_003318 [[Pythium] brassicae (nom. inval.)]
MLLQKQRLETERRLRDYEQDETAIRKRLEDTQLVLQQEREAKAQQGPLAAHLFPSSTKKTSNRRTESVAATATGASARTTDTHLPGMYVRIEDLSTDTLRTIAEQQELRDMAPLNTRGKYHARFMRDRYPIAGSQLKLENERAVCIAAKKKLLLENSLSTAGLGHQASTRAVTKLKSSMRRSLSLGTQFGAEYRKLDFYVDKMSDVLRTEELDVTQARRERQIRLVEVRHEEGLRQFWTLFHSAHKRARSFLDVNVPVHVVLTCQCVDMVSALFEHGAVPYLVTANGDTALHFLWREWLPTATGTNTTMKAVVELGVRAKSTFAILTALIAHGADPNAQNDFGETALQMCGRFGLAQCAKLLLAHHADVHAQDRHGKSAVVYASEHHHADLHRVLLNHDIIERTRAREAERRGCEALLKQGRGVLSSTWSQPPEKLFARLQVEEQRAGHLRSQFVDRSGCVLVFQEGNSDGDESATAREPRR